MSELQKTLTARAFAGPDRDASERLLVVANETLAGEGAVSAIEQLIGTEAQVLVVAPVLISRARYWTSDVSAGIERASERLAESLESLRARGIRAEGAVGDGHPLLAIEDALRHFPADHILIITHPPGRSNWLERRLVQRTRDRFPLSISHAVVDTTAAEGRTRSASLATAK